MLPSENFKKQNKSYKSDSWENVERSTAPKETKGSWKTKKCWRKPYFEDNSLDKDWRVFRQSTYQYAAIIKSVSNNEQQLIC